MTYTKGTTRRDNLSHGVTCLCSICGCLDPLNIYLRGDVYSLCVLQLGSPSDHHCYSRVTQQDRLRCITGVGGLVLGQDQHSGPGPVDAADWKDLGVPGLPHTPHPLHPHQEAYTQSGEASFITSVCAQFGA